MAPIVQHTLALGNELTFDTPASPSVYLSLTSSSIATFAPKRNDQVEATVRFADTPRVSQLDDAALQRLLAQRVRIQQIQENFEANYSDLVMGVRDAFENLKDLCRRYSDLIQEQQRIIQQIVIDFQSQFSGIGRSFRQQIAYAFALRTACIQATGVVSQISEEPPTSKNSSSPPRTRKRDKEWMMIPTETDIERSIRLWRRK
jgi:hypothetical protein